MRYAWFAVVSLYTTPQELPLFTLYLSIIHVDLGTVNVMLPGTRRQSPSDPDQDVRALLLMGPVGFVVSMAEVC